MNPDGYPCTVSNYGSSSRGRVTRTINFTENPMKTPHWSDLCKGLERWRGKTAVVTGAARGMGAQHAIALANVGMHVVGFDRQKHFAQELQAQVRGSGTGSISGRAVDLSIPAEVAAAFRWVEDQCEGVDLLVNNAGVNFEGQISDCGESPLSEAQLLETIDVNFKATVLCTRHVLNSMKRRNWPGHIVIINSIAGHFIPSSNLFNIYPATKHALTAFSTSLINELTQANSLIKVTSLSPGLVSTAMAAHVDQSNPMLSPCDVTEQLLHVLATPAHVNITEITVEPVRSRRL